MKPNLTKSEILSVCKQLQSGILALALETGRFWRLKGKVFSLNYDLKGLFGKFLWAG